MEAEVTRSIPSHTAVILFRDSSRGKDSYTEPLLEDHEAVESVAVLQHQDLLATQTIDDIIESHASDRPFAAVVFTSQNAVRALDRVLSKWTAADSPDQAAERREQWDRFISLPIFVVGGATGMACRSILLKHLPCMDVRGEVTGGASAMLPVITEFCTKYQTQNKGRTPRLVFFCGDQRRDTLPSGLHSGVAELHEVPTYTTVGRDPRDIRCDLIRAVNRIKVLCDASGGVLIWMAFFSPSGVRAVAPLLASLESEHILCAYAGGRVSPALSVPSVARYGVAAIGATTRDEIIAQLKPCLAVLANEPSVQGIRKSICKAHLG
ncbi:uroporphyrinogen-III synthase [Coemansia sp. S610]|nr:uroporphyrinogen-III synthase [Coemansia sp. S610]